MFSTITLNDMDLDVAKSLASYFAAISRLTKVYFFMPNIMSMTLEKAIQVPSPTISPNGDENPDRTQCIDAGHLCETAGYRCCNNGQGGNHKHGQTYKSRSFRKSTKKNFRRLLCCN
ncbi:unnamed protein product [Macrosiphum euphorbiae]|uniref:Uncharacterized protein n=1 Tax=Macrosiphum euphorbiae TaxID=13131 RepID=A0AAV0W1N0_9HEMI|nr:unnamed protein product [Macrosiphum euphorbiae]